MVWIVARLCAKAVLAAAGLSRGFISRWKTASQVWVRPSVGASVRNKSATGLTTRAVRGSGGTEEERSCLANRR